MSKRLLATAAVAVSASLTLGACGGTAAHATAAASSSKAPAGHTLTVKFELTDSQGGSSCTGGRGGYEDISPEAAVTVYDGSGKVIAIAPLGSDCVPGELDGETLNWDANWTTPVPNVPDASIYQVEVSHRGKLTFTKSDLEAKAWTVTASLHSSP